MIYKSDIRQKPRYIYLFVYGMSQNCRIYVNAQGDEYGLE